MTKYEFNDLYRATCANWWDIWKESAKIDNIEERNAFLDAKCHEYMMGVDYIHEALLMEKLTEVAKATLEFQQYPAFGRGGYDNELPFRV